MPLEFDNIVEKTNVCKGQVPDWAGGEFVEVVVVTRVPLWDAPVSMGLLVKDCSFLPKCSFSGSRLESWLKRTSSGTAFRRNSRESMPESARLHAARSRSRRKYRRGIFQAKVRSCFPYPAASSR